MHTLVIDTTSLFAVSLVLVLSLVIGTVFAFLYPLASGFVEILIGFASAIAGSRSSSPEKHVHKGFVAVRAVLYLGACIAAIVLCLQGHDYAAYLAAVLAGVSLPIAVGKLLFD